VLAGVALPGLGVEELLFLLLGQTFLFRAAVLVVAFLLVIIAPGFEAGFELIGDLLEAGEEVIAELFVERGADFLVAGGVAQGLNARQGKLAVEAQRALDDDLPVTECLVLEDF